MRMPVNLFMEANIARFKSGHGLMDGEDIFDENPDDPLDTPDMEQAALDLAEKEFLEMIY